MQLNKWDINPPMNGHLVGVQMMKHNMFLKNSPSTAQKRGLSRSFKNMMGGVTRKKVQQHYRGGMTP